MSPPPDRPDDPIHGPVESGRAATSGTHPGSLRRFFAARLDRDAYLGFHLTVGLVAASLALWIFGALLEEVLDDAAVVRWDRAVVEWVHARVTSGGLQALRLFTHFGDPAVMAVLAVAGALVIWRRHHRSLLITWIAAFAGGGIIDSLVKAAVGRARPSYGTEFLHGHSFSFPSGHAMGSIVGYGMLAYVTVAYGHPRYGRPWQVWLAAALIVAMIGVSRIYLGVHYPTDVLGGYAAGAAWLTVCLTALGVARRRPAPTAHLPRPPVA